ncbi:MAG: GNAT family N-acetyltransferase [Acidobacteria bacterium]|nr:MAG: GNAT family N-acetyltransferase [Acidobacteriota bacterium]
MPASIERGDVFVADEGGRVVGVAATERRQEELFLDRLAVDPSKQGTGLGRWLLLRLDEVARERGDQPLHRHGPILEDVRPDRRQGVNRGGRPHGHDVAGVVARPARVVVAARQDAALGDRGQERRRHARRVQALDDVAAAYLHLHQVPQLALEGGGDVLEARERPGVAALRADLAPRAPVEAVRERQLEHLGQVEVAGEDVALLAERSRLDAAARPALPRVFD